MALQMAAQASPVGTAALSLLRAFLRPIRRASPTMASPVRRPAHRAARAANAAIAFAVFATRRISSLDPPLLSFARAFTHSARCGGGRGLLACWPCLRARRGKGFDFRPSAAPAWRLRRGSGPTQPATHCRAAFRSRLRRLSPTRIHLPHSLGLVIVK